MTHTPPPTPLPAAVPSAGAGPPQQRSDFYLFTFCASSHFPCWIPGHLHHRLLPPPSFSSHGRDWMALESVGDWCLICVRPQSQGAWTTWEIAQFGLDGYFQLQLSASLDPSVRCFPVSSASEDPGAERGRAHEGLPADPAREHCAYCIRLCYQSI